MATVLIADDHEGLRTFMRFALEPLPYEIVEAADGEEAMRLAEAAPPDLAIVDLHMPRKDGFQVIAELRGLHGDRVKIVAMCGAEPGEIESRLPPAQRTGRCRSPFVPVSCGSSSKL